MCVRRVRACLCGVSRKGGRAEGRLRVQARRARTRQGKAGVGQADRRMGGEPTGSAARSSSSRRTRTRAPVRSPASAVGFAALNPLRSLRSSPCLANVRSTACAVSSRNTLHGNTAARRRAAAAHIRAAGAIAHERGDLRRAEQHLHLRDAAHTGRVYTRAGEGRHGRRATGRGWRRTLCATASGSARSPPRARAKGTR